MDRHLVAHLLQKVPVEKQQRILHRGEVPSNVDCRPVGHGHASSHVVGSAGHNEVHPSLCSEILERHRQGWVVFARGPQVLQEAIFELEEDAVADVVLKLDP